MLKKHRTREDAWSAFNGKAYNITHYLSYHPGGEKELMRVAGRDGSKLFGESTFHVKRNFAVTFNGLSFMCSTDPRVGEHRLYAR